MGQALNCFFGNLIYPPNTPEYQGLQLTGKKVQTKTTKEVPQVKTSTEHNIKLIKDAVQNLETALIKTQNEVSAITKSYGHSKVEEYKPSDRNKVKILITRHSSISKTKQGLENKLAEIEVVDITVQGVEAAKICHSVTLSQKETLDTVSKTISIQEIEEAQLELANLLKNSREFIDLVSDNPLLPDLNDSLIDFDSYINDEFIKDPPIQPEFPTVTDLPPLKGTKNHPTSGSTKNHSTSENLKNQKTKKNTGRKGRVIPVASQ